MSLSKTLVALGTWIEKHFPEKLTASEVNAHIQDICTAQTEQAEKIGDVARGIQAQNEYIATLVTRLADLEKKSEMFTSDMNKTKIMLLTQRQTAGR